MITNDWIMFKYVIINKLILDLSFPRIINL